MKTALAEQRRDRSAADETVKVMRADLAETIGAAADRIESLNRRMGGGAATPGPTQRR
jgi:hypothetical protein